MNAEGESDIVLVCEHAANRIPASLGDLGLDARALSSHVAWDPGAAEVARLLSRALDAPLVLPRFSRLVYDCNRPPEAESAMPARSELTDVPGNYSLSPAERAARAQAIYVPFRDALGGLLTARSARERPPVLVTIHSFTPVYAGRRRALDIGVLHDRDSRLADRIIEAAAGERDLVVRRNEPYGPADGVTHTLAVHAVARGLLNVMLEIRNDLLAGSAGRRALAERIAGWLTTALAANRDMAEGSARTGGRPLSEGGR